MSAFGFEPDGLFSASSSLAALEPAAASIAISTLRGYDAAAAAVVHPVLRQAFTSFGDQYAQLHHALAPGVKKAGVQVAKGTNALTNGQNESTAIHQATLAAGQQTRATLDRRLEG